MTTVRGRPLYLVLIRWVSIALAIIVVWFEPVLALALTLIGVGLPWVLAPRLKR